MPRYDLTPPDPADQALYVAACEAAGLTPTEFAERVVRMDGATGRAVALGRRALTRPQRQVVRAVLYDPGAHGPSLPAYLASAAA